MKYLAALGLFLSCSVYANPETQRLNHWLDEQFGEYVEFYPQLKKRFGSQGNHDQLDDASLLHRSVVLKWRQKSVQKMRAQFDRNQLSEQGRISYDLWVYLLQRAESSEPYRFHRYIFGRRGPHTSLPQSLIGSHNVETKQDMLDYIAKLTQVDRYLGQFLERAQASAKKGIRAPHFDYQIAASQSRKVITGTPFTSLELSLGPDQEEIAAPLWVDINTEIDKLVFNEVVSKSEAQDLRRQAKQALIDSVEPIYKKLIQWLETDVANTSVDAKGASSLPEGQRYYQHALNLNTTLALSADDIHEIGLTEVARIQAEMRDIKKVVGFDGDLTSFFVHMRESDEYFFPNTDEAREEYLALARSYIAGIETKLPEYFGVLPKAKLDVKRVEAYREQAGGSAHYSRGAPDGSRPGVFYTHLIDMRAAAVYRLENLAYHEGLPGHHMQISIQQEIQGLPRFRTHHGYTAFSEGWGLYSEYLGKEMGFYKSPYNDFGRLSGELWRSVRLVVDTGIHHMGWSQEKASQYALDNSPFPEVKARAEIRRYFNNPGQATAYKIGMLKIIELRRFAEQELGDSFDIRGFHDSVIGSGPLPLNILDRHVKSWIELQKATSP